MKTKPTLIPLSAQKPLSGVKAALREPLGSIHFPWFSFVWLFIHPYTNFFSAMSSRTFYPQTPVEFNSSLISSLDSSAETNYSRQQASAQVVEREVSKKLKELENNKLAKLDTKLSSLLLPNEDQGLSVASVNEQLSKAAESLKKLNDAKPAKSKALVDAETAVANCIKINKDKPLNCWDEVEHFKQLAKASN
ncbi:hypothetical protein KL918_004763 [Ogataea parapolymorpha]|nr:hypothetical protein KL918_004763 [Ogataea parapolymorpha]KAG7872766.1 hypothetical protein KL916_002811 [Ogataea parapolymorpha]